MLFSIPSSRLYQRWNERCQLNLKRKSLAIITVWRLRHVSYCAFACFISRSEDHQARFWLAINFLFPFHPAESVSIVIRDFGKVIIESIVWPATSCAAFVADDLSCI